MLCSPPPSAKNGAPGTTATPASRARRATSAPPASPSSSQVKNPPCGPRPRRPVADVAFERAHRGVAARAVDRPRAKDLLVEMAAAAVFLEQPLAERARALVGVLLRPDELGDELGRSRRPPEPHAGEERLRERPGLEHDVRREAPERRRSLTFEAEVAIRQVLEHEHAVPAGQLDERLAPLGRERHAGGVLEIGDRVDELRRFPGSRASARARRRRGRPRRPAPPRPRPRSSGTP